MVLLPLGPRPAPPVGTARVVIAGTVSGHAFVNVMYLKLTHSAAVTVNDLETILNGMRDAFASGLTAFFTTNVTYNSWSASFISAVGQSLDYTHTETFSGSNANIVNDASACYVIRWATGEYYRGGHPRSYLPGPQGNNIVNASTLQGATQTSLAAAMQTWLNAVNALTSTNVTKVDLGTVRYESNHAWLSPPYFVAFQSASVRPTIGSQRRRLLS